jgi:hypothetical protein
MSAVLKEVGDRQLPAGEWETQRQRWVGGGVLEMRTGETHLHTGVTGSRNLDLGRKRHQRASPSLSLFETHLLKYVNSLELLQVFFIVMIMHSFSNREIQEWFNQNSWRGLARDHSTANIISRGSNLHLFTSLPHMPTTPYGAPGDKLTFII